MTNVLRPSELLAFRWKCFDYDASTLKIKETVYKGKIRPWEKTRKSLTVIHIPQKLADDLQQWRDEWTSVRTRLLTPSCLPTKQAASRTRTTSVSVCFINWRAI
jgi:integrase